LQRKPLCYDKVDVCLLRAYLFIYVFLCVCVLYCHSYGE